LNINKLKQYVRKIIFSDLSTEKIALSSAIGVFIGTIIPLGLQTIVAVFLSLFVRINLVVTTAATLISNPITVLPIYISAIKIGEFVTGFSLTWAQFENVIDHPTIENIMTIGGDGIYLLITGLFIEGIVGSLLIYFLIRAAVTKLRSNQKNLQLNDQ